MVWMWRDSTGHFFTLSFVLEVSLSPHHHRKPGMSSMIKNIVADIDKGQFEFEDYGDIHTIGSLLKKFFQDLQDPLIPSQWAWLSSQWVWS